MTGTIAEICATIIAARARAIDVDFSFKGKPYEIARAVADDVLRKHVELMIAEAYLEGQRNCGLADDAAHKYAARIIDALVRP